MLTNEINVTLTAVQQRTFYLVVTTTGGRLRYSSRENSSVGVRRDVGRKHRWYHRATGHSTVPRLIDTCHFIPWGIDIDHMSQDAVDQTLSLAEAVTPGGYPLNSGHNNVRGAGLPASERALTVTQYRRIAALHGMAGVGSSGQDAASWLTLYNQVLTAMGPGAVAGFGTDTNGFGLGMPPRPGPQMRVVANPANAPCQDECPCGDLVTLQCTGCKAQCNRKYPPSTVCVARCDQPAPAVQYTDAFPASMDGPKT